MNAANLVIGMVSAIFGMVLGYLSYKLVIKSNEKNEKKEIKQEAKEESTTQTKFEMQLSYISRGIDDIKLDMKSQDRKINDINDRLIRTEESSKSAHKRIDELEFYKNEKENK